MSHERSAERGTGEHEGGGGEHEPASQVREISVALGPGVGGGRSPQLDGGVELVRQAEHVLLAVAVLDDGIAQPAGLEGGGDLERIHGGGYYFVQRHRRFADHTGQHRGERQAGIAFLDRYYRLHVRGDPGAAHTAATSWAASLLGRPSS